MVIPVILATIPLLLQNKTKLSESRSRCCVITKIASRCMGHGRRHRESRHARRAPTHPKCVRSLALIRMTETETRGILADNFTLHYVRHVGCIIITMGGVYGFSSATTLYDSQL